MSLEGKPLGSMSNAAVITLEVDKREWTVSSTGDGIFDAVMKAVIMGAQTFFPELQRVNISLVEWNPKAVTRGSDSLADVFVSMRFGNGDGTIHAGRSLSLDTVQAVAQAFANCISWYLSSVVAK